jgi:homoserine O-acetyltransferase
LGRVVTGTLEPEQGDVITGRCSKGDGMTDYEVFELGDIVLQSGITLPQAKLAYKTYGTLAAARDNVIVMPTFYGGQHADNEAMIGAGRALDPSRYFIIMPNMFGNSLSSSPSNTPPPVERAAFPGVSLYDNVTCQHRSSPSIWA